VLVAEIDVAALTATVTDRHVSTPVPAYPPVKEDIAVIVDESVEAAAWPASSAAPAGRCSPASRCSTSTGATRPARARRGLAFGLTYQAADRTLTDADATKIRSGIVRALQDELGAVLRG